jgi:Family of unknown function (DUF5709)
MSEHMPEHDPRSRLEDEGIPDLQDGTPEQQWAVDPQEAPVPGDRPLAADDFGTTVEEQIEGEPLDSRLGREVPEEEAVFGTDGAPAVKPGAAGPEPARAGSPDPAAAEAPGAGEPEDAGAGDSDTGDVPLTADSGLGVGSDLDTSFQPDDGNPVADWSAQPEEPSGQVWDAPRPAGRLVAPDQGAHADAEPDEVAEEVGPDMGGYTAEEAAMRVEPE